MISKLVAAAAIAAGVVTAAVAPVNAENIASSPTSDGGVVPYIIDGANPGGNRTCAEAGAAFAATFDFETARVNAEDISATAFEWIGASGPTGKYVTVIVTDGTFVEFESDSILVGAAIVKGSAAANVYFYPAGTLTDSGLASPVNPSSGSAALSNLTFCGYEPEDEEEGEWCSPGYWRQPQHAESWLATGIDPNELYSAYFGPVTVSKKAIADGATTNPTLIQVLQSPQWYGGEAFNNVGDLLSAAHPDVNFLGERVEDSCPLS